MEPWYGNYNDHCSLQAIPNEDEPTTGDNVSTGDQFSQRGRDAPEKHRSPEEKLHQKLKESEVSVDYSKFEPDSPDFDANEMEEGENEMEWGDRTDVSFQSMPNDSGDEEEQSVEPPKVVPAEPTPRSRKGHPSK